MRLLLGGWALLGVLGLVGCVGMAAAGPPAAVEGLPWGEAPVDRLCWSARRAVERGEPERALVQLATILRERPDCVDAQRLRQDVLRTRGRRGRVWNEALARRRERPEDGEAAYLLARVDVDAKRKLAGFEQAAVELPGTVWPWLGLAHTLRLTDRQRALQIYEGLFAASGQHPLVGVAYAASLRSAERWDAAALVYATMRGDRRVSGVAELGLAQVALARDQRGPGWAALLEALRRRPFDPGVQAMLRAWVESSATPDQQQQVLDVLREDGARMRTFAASAGGATMLAALLQRSGQTSAARSVLEARLAERATPDVRRELRRCLLALGDVDGFLARLRADVPRHVVDDERNQLRTRWLALLDGPFAAGDALQSAAQAEALLEALRDVGLLVELERVAALAIARFPGVAGSLAKLQDEARRELAFEAALRRLLYRGYQEGDTADLAEVVERIRKLSQRVLGSDVVGEPKQFYAPLVGEMLDPFGPGLCAHLARYNRHLVLGRRADGTAEALVATRLSVCELPPEEFLELPGRCYEVVGFERAIRPLGGVLGSDLAGVALLNHYLIDHDAVVDWALGLAARRSIARADGEALLRDELPEEAGMDPFDAAWRLTLQSPVADEDLEAAVLAMIRTHERRHLVDSFHYLPIEANLWRGVGLLASFAASPASIEAEMERRAELAALALSEHTELVLAHIVDFYGDPPLPSPHHRGFTQLLEELSAELERLGVAPDLAIPSRWHLLAMQQLRTAAKNLLQDLPREN
ncbi:MAG: hypothetical protein AB8H80_14985 [Planctomycetota bacterium]